MIPVISSLKLRCFQGERDYASLAAILTASERADRTERAVTAQQMAYAYQHLSNCDPFSDIVIAEIAREPVGYARGWWEDEAQASRLYRHNAFLLPEWRRKGIGTAMLRWIEDRLRAIAVDHPSDRARFLQVNVTQFQQGTAMMLERTGYQAVRYFYEMMRPTLDDIPACSLPNGIELRRVLPEHYRALWKSVDETSQDEWGYKKPKEEDYQAWLAGPHFQPRLWQVAWDVATNQIVGHLLTFIDHEENEQFNRKRGYTEGLGVDRTWRRRGLARALISKSLQAQREAGMRESALAADTAGESGVTRLYESCGFQIIKRDTIYRKAM